MTAITSWRGTSSRIPTIFISERHRASVAGRFLDRFEQIVDQEIRDRAQEMGMTIDEVVTLASVIQAECSYPSEMANVSGVFHNRLDDPANYPKLQSDVTIFYIRTRSCPMPAAIPRTFTISSTTPTSTADCRWGRSAVR